MEYELKTVDGEIYRIELSDPDKAQWKSAFSFIEVTKEHKDIGVSELRRYLIPRSSIASVRLDTPAKKRSQ
jgi:hypothetical protein